MRLRRAIDRLMFALGWARVAPPRPPAPMVEAVFEGGPRDGLVLSMCPGSSKVNFPVASATLGNFGDTPQFGMATYHLVRQVYRHGDGEAA